MVNGDMHGGGWHDQWTWRWLAGRGGLEATRGLGFQTKNVRHEKGSRRRFETMCARGKGNVKVLLFYFLRFFNLSFH